MSQRTLQHLKILLPYQLPKDLVMVVMNSLNNYTKIKCNFSICS